MKPALNWARSLVWRWRQNEEMKARTTDAYLTYSSPNTAHSCSFSSAHLATWEGGEEEDGGGRNVDNVTWKTTLMEKHISFSLLTINPSSLVGLFLFNCIFYVHVNGEKSWNRKSSCIVACSFHQVKQSKSQRYVHVICNSLMCKSSHLRN